MKQRTLAITLTCHNRAATTVRCLQGVYGQELAPDIRIEIFLVDDGSTDGTSAAVRDNFPDVHIIPGSGELYWNGGMHRAFAAALAQGFDFYLWLNDDTHLESDSISRLIATHDELNARDGAPIIVAGATKDPVSGKFSYGGYRQKPGIVPLRLTLLPESDRPVRCATMCGNIVLISREAAQRTGNLDEHYTHRWGDVDYGLRAGKAGCHNYVAAGFIGSCEDNPKADTWRSANLTLRQRFAALHDIRGLHKEDWRRFTRLHGGPLWPLIWVRPYVQICWTHLKRVIGGPRLTARAG